MRKDLLLSIAQAVREAPLGQFNMSRWKQECNCGTTCCAIGWAMERGLLPELEWRAAERSIEGPLLFIPVPKGTPEESQPDLVLVLADILDLTPRQVEYLFIPIIFLNFNYDRESVALRIEDFVNTGVVHDPENLLGEEA